MLKYNLELMQILVFKGLFGEFLRCWVVVSMTRFSGCISSFHDFDVHRIGGEMIQFNECCFHLVDSFNHHLL